MRGTKEMSAMTLTRYSRKESNIDITNWTWQREEERRIKL
jgi:hypothetical protein